METVKLGSPLNAMASLAQGYGKWRKQFPLEERAEEVHLRVYGIPLFSGTTRTCKRYSPLAEILQGDPSMIWKDT